MSAAADDTDGDRVIEVVSAGALYRGEEWERKYWSCSRVTSTEGDSATGATPDLAWKNFKKKSGAKLTNWQRRRSFPQKIDGAEACPDLWSLCSFAFHVKLKCFLGSKMHLFRDCFVRELIVYTTGAVMQKLPGAVIADSASTSLNKDTTDVFDVDRLPVCLDKTSRIGATVSTTVDKGTNINSSETYLHGGSPCDMAKGGSANGDCSKDECVVKLHGIKDVVEDTFEDVDSWDDDTSKSRVVHHYVSDDACSREPNEHLKDEFEVKLDEMKDVVEDSFEDAYILADNPLKSRAVCHHMSDDACSRQPNQHSKDDSVAKLDEMKDVVEDSFEEDANIWGDNTFKSRPVRYHTSDDACSRLRNEQLKNESAEDSFGQLEHICGDNTSKTRAVCHHRSDDACSRQPNEHLKDESVAKLDEMIDFVEDSFEEDAHIMGDNTSKFRAFGHHVSDDACSIEPNEHSKVLDGVIKGHVETFECQEEFGGDECPYPENYNHCNSMSHTNGMKAGSVSLDLLCNENIDNGLVDYTFGRSCFTPDGQFVVLMSSVGIPFLQVGKH
ncbi:hypothetical protein PR202_ga30170 [Eleusine coracana subsp. coracana]|uniref:Uncharacterized protein n=1 Tax=Eleusine coracana subsp. coracana TaxID=191504 RepID=A0AAV5DNN2_ELECO|nr:hypothetical protein PR202_ga30170 [Eleusine coracana subsp. coracana]